MTSRKRSIILRLAPVFIILFGVLLMILLAKHHQPPVRGRAASQGPLVEMKQVHSDDRPTIIEGNGTVSPRFEITLIPQVSGKVIYVHPNLVAGGEFSADDELIRIEPVDYELAVQRSRAQVAQAEYQLSVSRANASIAEREWELVTSDNKDKSSNDTSLPASPDPLVLHTPQLHQAEANLISAQAGLAAAELSLSRTVLRAPFNCRVRQQNVSPGQLVGPASHLAILYGTDLVEIAIGLPISELAWLEIPGAPVEVILDTGTEKMQWTGTLNRSVGVIEEVGRLARVIVQVQDPFKQQTPTSPELAIGSFVSVTIEGRSLSRVFPIPRSALHENNSVWVIAPDNTLDIRHVQLARLTGTEAFVTQGLQENDRIILSQISSVAPGMRLRPAPSTPGDK